MNILRKIIDAISVTILAVMVIVIVAILILILVGLFSGLISFELMDLAKMIIYLVFMFLIINGFIVVVDWTTNHKFKD